MSREEDRETLEKFFNCVREQNYQDIEEAYKAVCKMPECYSPDAQYHTYGKAYYIDERIYPTENNVDFHPYIKGYFDMAVTEQMGWGIEVSGDLKRIKQYNDSAEFDGTRELVFFLNNYRYLKDTLEKQGKEIFRPDTFDKYPFLEDYVKGIFRDDYDSVTQDAAQCKTISELVKNKDAVENYCNAGIFVYNATEYWHNIEKKYKEWGKQKWREIYTEAEDETFRQGNIASLSDEEKKFILENTENADRAIQVGKTVNNEILDNLDFGPMPILKAEILFARAEKPEELSDADKEFILKWSVSEKTLEAVAKVYDFKAQSSEKLKDLLRWVEHKEIRKDIAKEYIDSCKGDVTYDRLISEVFTKEEFDKAVEDYKITQYRRENEKLKQENIKISENMEQLKAEVREEKEALANKESEVAKAVARVAAKEKELGFLKDIPIVCQGMQKEVDAFAPERKKELFYKMEDDMLDDANLRESHLVGMCKIYASKTNTPEDKAAYFEQLHAIRKSGNSNAEKREMARTFGRVLERNPDLAKDEALQGLAKIDYSAVGYTPTRHGFAKGE